MTDQLEDELHRHSGAVRALARLLVGNQHAEDLVQDTALQALQSPPGQPTGLRPWLLAVLRFRAGKLRRREQSRERREALVEPPAAPSDPHRLAERMEALTRLHEALRALPQPYLGTLLQRFFEDLTPTAIAARTQTPLATVKSRLQRGLEMLRQQLDAKASDWRQSFGITFGLPVALGATTTSAAAAAASSGVFMAIHLKTIGAVLASVAVVTTAWRLATPDAPHVVPSSPGGRPAIATSARQERDAGREAVPPPAPAGQSVQVRVLDPAGTSLPGVDVFHLVSPDGFDDLDATGRLRLAAIAHDDEAVLREFGRVARSDPAGIARWPHDETKRSWWWLGASHDGAFGQVWLNTQTRADEVVELHLHVARSFTVQVLDASRAPLADVPIVARFVRATEGAPATIKRIAITGESGMAEARNVQSWRESVATRGDSRPVDVLPELPGVDTTAAVDVAHPPAAPVQLVLPPTGAIAVTVLDADGSPVSPGGTVRLVEVPTLDTAPSWSAPIATAGTAVFAHVGLQRRWRIHRDGPTPLAREFDGPRSPGDVVRVQLRPDPTPVLTGRLLAGGAPVARTRFTLVVAGHLASREPMATDDTGSFRVACTASLAAGTIVQHATCTRLDERGQDAGWTATWQGRLTLGVGAHDLGDLELVEQPLVVAGRLATDDGRPPDEAVVLWVEAATGDATTPWQQVGLRNQRQPDGTFMFRGTPPAAPLRLCVWTRSRYLPVPPVPFASPTRDVTVALQRGGSVRASVLVQSQEQMFCTTPVLRPTVPREEPLLFARYAMEQDPAVPLECSIVDRHDGALEVAYTWPAVAPGHYRLQVRTRSVAAPLLEVADVLVVAGQRTEDARLQQLRPSGVRVVKLALPQASALLDRASPSGAGVVFVLDGDTPTDQCMQVDAPFVLFASVRPLDVLVRLHGRRDLVVRGVFEDRTLELEPGMPCTLECDVTHQPKDTQIAITLTACDDAMAAASPWLYSPAAGGSLGAPRYRSPAQTRPLTAGVAHFTLPTPGRYRITATATGPSGEVTTVTVTPGEVQCGPIDTRCRVQLQMPR